MDWTTPRTSEGCNVKKRSVCAKVSFYQFCFTISSSPYPSCLRFHVCVWAAFIKAPFMSVLKPYLTFSDCVYFWIAIVNRATMSVAPGDESHNEATLSLGLHITSLRPGPHKPHSRQVVDEQEIGRVCSCRRQKRAKTTTMKRQFRHFISTTPNEALVVLFVLSSTTAVTS